MRVYCSRPLSIFLARTYRSPRVLALFQSRGWDSTTLTYSAIAASTLPSFRPFSAAFNAASRSNGGTLTTLNQWYQAGCRVGTCAGVERSSQTEPPRRDGRPSHTLYVGQTRILGQRRGAPASIDPSSLLPRLTRRRWQMRGDRRQSRPAAPSATTE